MLDAQYELHIADCSDPWIVTDVRISESISALYSVAIRATLSSSTGPVGSDAQLIGNDVTLNIRSAGLSRPIHGLIKRVTITEAIQHRVHILDIEVVPALWLLTRDIDSRVYHDATVSAVVRDVVQRILSVRARTVVSEIVGPEPIHEYLVQYHETSFDFIQRICAREGVSFHFSCAAGGHEVLVLTDQNHAFPPIDPATSGAIPYLHNVPDARSIAGVNDIRCVHQIGAFDATVSGYNWTKPDQPLRAERLARGLNDNVTLQVYQPHQEVHYHNYQGLVYERDTAEQRVTQLVDTLDMVRERWTLTTSSILVRTGHRLKLIGELPPGVDEEFVVVGLRGNGHGDISSDTVGSYEATADVVPARLRVRPAPAKRCFVNGPETGIVVASHKGSREEIETDEHGRILVRLHWDRDVSDRTSSTAWLRVTQAWAGANWGALFIPRVGMEVVVQFLGGDPDRPFVSGCLYNKQNRPPITLPAEKTKSTLKSNSSIGGSGYNQLLFEDDAGNELVHIHAQKDLDTKVLHDHREFVGNDESLGVIANRTRSVGKDESVDIDGNQSITVAKDRTLTIEEGNRTTTVEQGNEVLTVNAGNRTVRVTKGDDAHKIDEGSRSVSIKANDSLDVQGDQTIVVKGDRTIRVEQGDEEVKIVAGSLKIEAQSGSIQVAGNEVEIKSSTTLTITGGAGIKVVCGGSSIELSPAMITIQAPLVKIN